MAGPAEIVTESWKLAQTYARDAQTELTKFAEALRQSIYTAPKITYHWNTPNAPSARIAAELPTLPEVAFDPDVLNHRPQALVEDLPVPTMGAFTDTPPVLNLPDAPAVTYGVMPEVPSVRDVVVPDAPVLEDVPRPEMLALNVVTFGGVDLHEDWLEGLKERPELSIAQPTPYSYTRGDAYASELLDKLKAVLSERINGGTGLPPAVEQAIWGRARDRETNIAMANQQEVMRTSEALGFPLPPGVLAAQVRSAQKAYYDKLSDFSRDVAIKQADLEQSNLREAIAAGMQLESSLMDYSYKLESLAFEDAKAAAENAVALQRAALENYQALLRAYETFASAYKTIIEGQLAKVEIYKAQLQGEQTKAEINKLKVEEFKALIDAGMAQVEIYKAQLGAAQTMVGLEEARIGAATEQIKAFVAQMNAETSKVEIYKAQLQGEQIKQQTHKTKAEIYAIQEGAKAEYSRTLAARYQALMAGNAGEWDAFRARVQAEGQRLDALGRQSDALLAAFRAATAVDQANAEIAVKQWEASLGQYSAQAQTAIQVAKVNTDATLTANNARMDAAKAGTQVYAQLTASAYNIVNTTASIGSDVNYNYSGAAPVIT